MCQPIQHAHNAVSRDRTLHVEATASWVASSTITRHLIALPSAVRSNTTSIDHTWLALVGRSNGARSPTGTFFTRAAANLQLLLAIQPLHPLIVHETPFLPQLREIIPTP